MPYLCCPLLVRLWLVVLTALVPVLFPLHAHALWLHDEQAIMGTSVRVELWHEDEVAGKAAIAAVMEEMHRIDRGMSPFMPSSELSRVNQLAAARPVRCRASAGGGHHPRQRSVARY